MQLQPGLTKENCFNELQAKYPKAMKVFCDWIDEYKKAVDWESLFNATKDHTYNLPEWGRESVLAPKFHELPYAMQLGIWFAFLQDKKLESGRVNADSAECLELAMNSVFKYMETL